MIARIEGTKNGYTLTETSTNKDFQKILTKYPKINCIITNENTARAFRYGMACLGDNRSVIRKDLRNGEFYINGHY